MLLRVGVDIMQQRQRAQLRNAQGDPGGRHERRTGNCPAFPILATRRPQVDTVHPIFRARGMITLYDYLDSGNGYKIRLLLSQLGQRYHWKGLDILTGETRTPEFLAKNPNGRIPTLELDDGTHLAESNAILWYLAEGTAFIPDDRLARARILQWMFFEQYSHEPYIATSRFIFKHLPESSPRRAELPDRLTRGRAALDVMETHLSGRSFFVGDHYTIADIALYAYTHVAHEAYLDLAPYPAVRQWLSRVTEQPRHILITDLPHSPAVA
jgi:glutathione S-transferase